MKSQGYYGWLGILVVGLICAIVVIFSPERWIEQKPIKITTPLSLANLSASFDQAVPQPLTKVPTTKGFVLNECLQFNSFDERLTYLRKLAPSPIVFPDGFADFIHTEDVKSNWDKGNVLFLTERDGAQGGDTVRDCLSAGFSPLTLSWNYDPDRGVITTEFQWLRDDPRTAQELVDFLSNNRPTPYQWLQTRGMTWAPFGGKREQETDPWINAFNALLSKPENYPQVWKLRFVDDVRRYFTPAIIDNLFAKRMHDDKRSEHIVIVNDQPLIMYPGEGSFAYYIFDLNGKFEKGGVLRSGHRCGDSTMWLNGPGNELTLRNFFNDKDTIDTVFALTDRGLILSRLQTGFASGLGIGQTIYLTNP